MVTVRRKRQGSNTRLAKFEAKHFFLTYVRVISLSEKRRERGWFPRKCAVEIYENGDATASTNQPEDEKKEN